MKHKNGRPLTKQFKLRPHDRGKLNNIITARAKTDARVYQRALILLKLSEGLGLTETAKVLGVSIDTIKRRRDRYVAEGLESALNDGYRSGQPRRLNKEQEQRIVALACTDPPDGNSHWSHRLLAQEAVSRGIVDSLSHQTIHIVLQRHELKPWREKNVVCHKTR